MVVRLINLYQEFTIVLLLQLEITLLVLWIGQILAQFLDLLSQIF